jgi:hypothetical protein
MQMHEDPKSKMIAFHEGLPIAALSDAPSAI